MLARVKEDINELQISPAPLFDQLGDGIIVTADYNLPRDRHNSLGSGDSSGKVSIKKGWNVNVRKCSKLIEESEKNIFGMMKITAYS